MSADFWATVTGSLLSGAVILGGINITNRHSYKRQQIDVYEKRNESKIELIANIIVSGREWVGMQEVLVFSEDRATLEGFMAFAETESGKELTELNKNLRTFLTKAELLISDENLNSNIVALSNFITKFPEIVTKLIFDQKGSFESRLEGARRIWAFRNLLEVVAKDARTTLGAKNPYDRESKLGIQFEEIGKTLAASGGIL